MTKQLTLLQPDDWHLHLRDHEFMQSVVADTARVFGRAIIMPNLQQPISSTEQALQYRERILSALPEGSSFQPLMTLYLTDQTSSQEIRKAHASGYIYAVKLYPAGATTNSAAGVESLDHRFPILETMQELGMPLLIHGEVTTADVDIFDREKVFLETTLAPLIQRFPALRVVFEHATTQEAVEFVEAQNQNVAATITAHHLLINRNDMLVGGIKPHHFCLPIVKREKHRQALLQAATSGNAKFFLGTDSAPHPIGAKESACGCAGIYTAHEALPFYAEAFDSVGKLDKLEGFASCFGPDFYRLPRNSKKVTLEKSPQKIPLELLFGKSKLSPFKAGETIHWRMC